MPKQPKVQSPKSKAEGPVPNIAFVGARDGREPLRQIVNGNQVIDLPEDQSDPFYHGEAKTICRLFGWLYKPVEPKG